MRPDRTSLHKIRTSFLLITAFLTSFVAPAVSMACSGPQDYSDYLLDVILTKKAGPRELSVIIATGAEFLKMATVRGEKFNEDIANGIVSVEIIKTSCGFGPTLIKTTLENARRIKAANQHGSLSLTLREKGSKSPSAYHGDLAAIEQSLRRGARAK